MTQANAPVIPGEAVGRDPGSSSGYAPLATEKRFFVYILATRKDGPIYIGVTSDLVRRVFLHRTHAVSSLTARFNVTRLVYFEEHASAESAIAREKRIKRWRREWKVALIEAENPDWRDLWQETAGWTPPDQGSSSPARPSGRDPGSSSGRSRAEGSEPSDDPGSPLRFGRDDGHPGEDRVGR